MCKVCYKIFEYNQKANMSIKKMGMFGIEYEYTERVYKYEHPENVRNAAMEFASSLQTGCLINISGGGDMFESGIGTRVGSVIVYYFDYEK